MSTLTEFETAAAQGTLPTPDAESHPLKRIARDRVVQISVAILALLVALALAAPLLAPTELGERVGPGYAPPSSAHPLGLDDGGQDVLTLLLWGARTSLLVGFAAAALGALLGSAIGIISGYASGRVDTVLMRGTDYVLSVPDVPLLIVAAALFGPSLRNIIIGVALLSWAGTARIVRAETKGLRARPYVVRVHALGASDWLVVRRHIIPHLVPLIVAIAVLTVAGAIFAETALSFLGLGDPTSASWGKMIANAFSGAATSAGAWWAILPPGIALCIVVLASTMLGRSIEAIVNPRSTSPHFGGRPSLYRGIGPRPTDEERAA